MRAVYHPELTLQESYSITGDPLHHLLNVIRIQKHQELLLLNGKGLGVLGQVEDLNKKELRLKFLKSIEQERKFILDLALGIPKKEALELCLKQATELCFRKIYLVRADHSQIRVPEADRLQKLLVSALEQANGFYLPEVQEVGWKDIPWNHYTRSVLLDSQTAEEAKNAANPQKGPGILIVGPEGGFSDGELGYLRSLPQVENLLLPTGILRTPTALATGAGIMLERLLK